MQPLLLAGKRKRQVGHIFTIGFTNCYDFHMQDEDWWLESIAGFDVAVGRPDTLCGWVVGQAALHVETLTEEQV